MSSRHNIQDATGRVEYLSGYGTIEAWGTGAPTNSVGGFSPGCLYHRVDGGAGTAIYVNEGTYTSSTWVAIGTGSLSLTSLSVTTLTTDAINMAAAAGVITIKANTQHALEVTDATTIMVDVDSRNTIANVSNVLLTASAPTIASAAAVHKNPTLELAAKTITYSGTNTVTSSLGAQLYINAPTFTDASAGTVTTVSTVHIVAPAAAGGALTITNTRMISTSVTDCYLTGAGVWTDTACWSWGKKAIEAAAPARVLEVLESLVPTTWRYAEDVHGDDRGRERVGITYDDLPEELRAPGSERGVSAGVLASFALAALRVLLDEDRRLEGRLAALEAR